MESIKVRRAVFFFFFFVPKTQKRERNSSRMITLHARKRIKLFRHQNATKSPPLLYFFSSLRNSSHAYIPVCLTYTLFVRGKKKNAERARMIEPAQPKNNKSEWETVSPTNVFVFEIAVSAQSTTIKRTLLRTNSLTLKKKQNFTFRKECAPNKS